MLRECKRVRKRIKTEGLNISSAGRGARERKMGGHRGKAGGLPEINSEGHITC
jgi:hypothetical protein